jgi:group I intron endonuclease
MSNTPIKNCIYQIRSVITKEIYVGSAVNFKGRKSTHLRALEKGIHPNKPMQLHYKEHGPLGFEFSVLKLSSRENLISDEQHFIDTLKPQFNISKFATSTLGIQMQAHVKQALKDSQHKIIRDEVYRKKMSDSLIGREFSIEHRAKIGDKSRGKVLSESTRNLISRARIGRFKGADNPNSKKILCLNNDIIYQSARAAAEELGISDKHIGSVCKGNRAHTHNYKFVYVD